MKSVIAASFLLAVLGLSDVTVANESSHQPVGAHVLRAAEMTGKDWALLEAKGEESYLIEFRQGDQIPVTFASQGDLLESTQTGITLIRVKRSFWLQISQAGVNFSFDGTVFKPISDVVQGSFSAGSNAQPGVPVNAVQLMLKAYLK